MKLITGYPTVFTPFLIAALLIKYCADDIFGLPCLSQHHILNAKSFDLLCQFLSSSSRWPQRQELPYSPWQRLP
jgi:hypothetical protein